MKAVFIIKQTFFILNVIVAKLTFSDSSLRRYSNTTSDTSPKAILYTFFYPETLISRFICLQPGFNVNGQSKVFKITSLSGLELFLNTKERENLNFFFIVIYTVLCSSFFFNRIVCFNILLLCGWFQSWKPIRKIYRQEPLSSF